MAKAFRRATNLTIEDSTGVLNIASADQGGRILRVVFSIRHEYSPEPNGAKVTIYNLGEDLRARLTAAGVNAQQSSLNTGLTVNLEAGYVDDLKRIFRGDLGFIRHELKPPDWMTTIEAGDGQVRYKKARISKSFPPNSTLQQVVNELLDEFGLEDGNIRTRVQQATLRASQRLFRNGKVAKGKVAGILSSILKSSGLDMVIQGKEVNALDPNEVYVEPRFVLTPDTGLIGSPQVGELSYVRVRSILNGDIVPGKGIDIESRIATGTYKVIKVTHTGDTQGNNWYTDIEAKPIETEGPTAEAGTGFA